MVELEDDIAFQLSNLVEDIRLRHGLTQEQFAEKVGIRQSAVARMERGSVVPTIPSLQRIAKAFTLKLVVSLKPKRAAIEAHAASSTAKAVPMPAPSPYYSAKDFSSAGDTSIINLTK